MNKGVINISKEYIYPYNRKLAYEYAKKWAFLRNDRYYNFDFVGGDCTNFVSQVLYAGGCKMNYKKWFGWYYKNVNDRSASWTSVEYLYRFLINNNETGPIGKIVEINELEIGDVIQLSFNENNIFNHSLVVTNIERPINENNIFIATHTYDRFNYALSKYLYKDIRYIHILGYKL